MPGGQVEVLDKDPENRRLVGKRPQQAVAGVERGVGLGWIAGGVRARDEFPQIGV